LVIRAQECVHDVIMDPIYRVPHLYTYIKKLIERNLNTYLIADLRVCRTELANRIVK